MRFQAWYFWNRRNHRLPFCRLTQLSRIRECHAWSDFGGRLCCGCRI